MHIINSLTLISAHSSLVLSTPPPIFNRFNKPPDRIVLHKLKPNKTACMTPFSENSSKTIILLASNLLEKFVTYICEQKN